jgi:hypothetical protein
MKIWNFRNFLKFSFLMVFFFKFSMYLSAVTDIDIITPLSYPLKWYWSRDYVDVTIHNTEPDFLMSKYMISLIWYGSFRITSRINPRTNTVVMFFQYYICKFPLFNTKYMININFWNIEWTFFEILRKFRFFFIFCEILGNFLKVLKFYEDLKFSKFFEIFVLSILIICLCIVVNMTCIISHF